MVISRDLQAFMKFKQEQIQELIDQKFSAGPQKVQFSAELQLLKQFREPDEDDEDITIFANSLMTPVYSEGLSNDSFVEMVEKMLTVLFSFASSGVDGCLKNFFASISSWPRTDRPAALPISTYMQHLQKCNSLINIRNHTDINCFIYSIVAASYLKHNDSEGEEDRNDSLKLTSPEFYQNIQPAGEFEMPVGFNDIDKSKHLTT